MQVVYGAYPLILVVGIEEVFMLTPSPSAMLFKEVKDNPLTPFST
jgi:hypothetical protein